MGGKKGSKVKIYKKRRKTIPEEILIANLQARYEQIDETKIKKFSDLPLSPKTLKGLKENNWTEPTDIQRQSIGLALRGNDILGAAQTGSGKTLAFLIPVLELLYCKKWSQLDGLGALIITPTRELAYQIYETLRKVGAHHNISAGLIIGGKDLNFEKKRMDRCNIIICTPGRILEHMDNNQLLDCSSTQVLVLDEADRCLDMGFKQTMNAIIGYLPPGRQTLLFSATQTKSVKDLARLSLKDPMYVSVHEHAKHTTPQGLQQSYIVCNLEDKMSMLWSFIKNHLKHKVIVFFSTCKQVKYTYDVFCRMRPGITLLALHGRLHQLKRMSIYDDFCRKQNAVLFATDIASRGLDFPDVNWVLQMDCPEDTDQYIHRAGRTARFERGGESLLVLLPSEEPMVEKLCDRKIPISMIKINQNRLISPQRKLEALLARDVALKQTAQRAFSTYIRSVSMMKDRQIFNVHALDTDSYARSLGLAIPPRIRFLDRMQQKSARVEKSRTAKYEKEVLIKLAKAALSKKEKFDDDSASNESDDNSASNKSDDDSASNKSDDDSTSNKSDDDSTSNESDDDSTSNESDEEVQERITSQTRQHDSYKALFAIDDSDEDDILTVKRKNVEIEGELPEDLDDEIVASSSRNKKAVTKAALAKKMLRKNIVANKKTTFDEDGQELVDPARSKVSELAKQYENIETNGIDIKLAKKILREEDQFDKKRYQAMVKERHREKKRKLKAEKKAAASDEEDEERRTGIQLAEYESESEAELPDLSWLPDPDKIYGPKKDSDDEESNKDPDGDEDTHEDDQIHRPSKRKLVTQEEVKKKRRKSSKSKENSDLVATEELALQLLQN